MILLPSTSSDIDLITSAAGAIAVHASWLDWEGASTYGGAANPASITTATTTNIVAAPAASRVRSVKGLSIRNTHASVANTCTVVHTDGAVSAEIYKVTLPAGWSARCGEDFEWAVYDASGREVLASVVTDTPTVNVLNTVVLSADVTANAVANTIADVTGLSFAVVTGQTYWFRAVVDYTSGATTTGSRWSVNGPGSPTRLSYRSSYSLSTTSETVNSGLGAYDLPAAASATSAATTGNTAVVEGHITPSSDGTVTIRFASETTTAVVAKAGSILQWMRVL